MGELARGERLQVMLSDEELAALDDWRFKARMPSRASAIRELLKRGLHAEGFSVAASKTKSGDYGVLGPDVDGYDNGDGHDQERVDRLPQGLFDGPQD